jgi:hypothetical protein
MIKLSSEIDPIIQIPEANYLSPDKSSRKKPQLKKTQSH